MDAGDTPVRRRFKGNKHVGRLLRTARSGQCDAPQSRVENSRGPRCPPMGECLSRPPPSLPSSAATSRRAPCGAATSRHRRLSPFPHSWVRAPSRIARPTDRREIGERSAEIGRDRPSEPPSTRTWVGCTDRRLARRGPPESLPRSRPRSAEGHPRASPSLLTLHMMSHDGHGSSPHSLAAREGTAG